MAQTIKLKRSASAGAVPSTSDLELGEIALNTRDGAVYIKKNDGSSDSIVAVHDNDILHIDTSNGRIGIGTTSPSYKLDVNSGTSDWPARFISSDDKAGIIIADNDTVNYLVSRNSFLSIGSISDLSATNLNVKSSGEVGIGTTSPGHALDVVGTGKPAIEATCSAGHFAIEASTPYDYVAKFSSTDAGAAIILQDNSSTNHANRINVSGDTMQFVTAATTAVTIDASQNVGIGTCISYNASADNILTIGATNRTSVDNGRYFNFQFKVSGGATGQDLIIQAARNIDGSSEDTESIFQ